MRGDPSPRLVEGVGVRLIRMKYREIRLRLEMQSGEVFPRPAMNRNSTIVFGLVAMIVVASVAIASLVSPPIGPGCRGRGCLPVISESYTPCILGYAGFQVTRQYPNPSTWTFELAQGSTGYIYYEYNVTKGLNSFLSQLNGTWTIWQVLSNGTNLLAEVSGSTVTRAKSFVPNSNQPDVERAPQLYNLGVQLSLVSYAVRGSSVNASWSFKGLIPGSYPVEASDLVWHTIDVVSTSAHVLNATSEFFSGNCKGGTING